jgi:hypothetical protein
MSPETLWDMQELDSIDLENMPNFLDNIEEFLKHSNFDSRSLFILTAVSRITKKKVRLIN